MRALKALLLAVATAAGAKPVAVSPFRCVNPDWENAAVRIAPDGEAECYSLDGILCLPICARRNSPKGEWTPPPGQKWVVISCKGKGGQRYGDPMDFCRHACQALPGCVHKSVPMRPQDHRPPPPRVERSKREPPPPPPAQIDGEGPCRNDADCSLANGRSCCGCATLEVRSRLRKPEPPPACGCGDMGAMQRFPVPRLNGEEPESFGPCGRPPPRADEYSAACRNRACVGLRR